MGTLWSEFRRGMRRGKPPPLPAGLARCEECAEPRGQAWFTDRAPAPRRRWTSPASARACLRVVRSSAGSAARPAIGSMRRPPRCGIPARGLANVPCAHCRADGAAGPPGHPDVAGYDIRATSFYGEAPASADLQRQAVPGCSRAVSPASPPPRCRTGQCQTGAGCLAGSAQTGGGGFGERACRRRAGAHGGSRPALGQEVVICCQRRASR